MCRCASGVAAVHRRLECKRGSVCIALRLASGLSTFLQIFDADSIVYVDGIPRLTDNTACIYYQGPFCTHVAPDLASDAALLEKCGHTATTANTLAEPELLPAGQAHMGDGPAAESELAELEQRGCQFCPSGSSCAYESPGAHILAKQLEDP